MTTRFPSVPLSQVLTPVERSETPQPGTTYRLFGVKWWGEGVYEREAVDGSQTQYAKLSRIEANDIVINKIWARHGSVAVVQENLAGCYGGSEFPTFLPDFKQLEPRWIHWLSKTAAFWGWCAEKSYGTSGKNRIRPEQFLAVEIPLPPLDEQRRIVAHIEALAVRIAEARGLRQQAVEEAEKLALEAPAQVFQGIEASSKTVPVGETFTFRYDLIHPTDGESGPLRFIGLQHIESHTGKRIGEDQLLAEELKGRKFRFSPGEIVYGYLRPYLNKVWVADCDGFCSVDQYVIQPKPDIVDTQYLAHYMRSKSFLSRAIELTHNLQLPRLRSGLLEGIPIPISAIDKQRQIVTYLDGLQADIGRLKRLQAETAAELDALLPAVLDRAFRGELL